jgi:hypothetical protein
MRRRSGRDRSRLEQVPTPAGESRLDVDRLPVRRFDGEACRNQVA